MTDKTGLHHLISVPITMYDNLEKKAKISASKLVAIKLKGKIVTTISETVFFENCNEQGQTLSQGRVLDRMNFNLTIRRVIGIGIKKLVSLLTSRSLRRVMHVFVLLARSLILLLFLVFVSFIIASSAFACSFYNSKSFNDTLMG